MDQRDGKKGDVDIAAMTESLSAGGVIIRGAVPGATLTEQVLEFVDQYVPEAAGEKIPNKKEG